MDFSGGGDGQLVLVGGRSLGERGEIGVGRGKSRVKWGLFEGGGGGELGGGGRTGGVGLSSRGGGHELLPERLGFDLFFHLNS